MDRTPEPLLEIRNLSVGFESTAVLQGITFDVMDNEVFALMGPAGVGKSTLLRTLARYNEPLPSYWAHGRVLFSGRDLLREVPLEQARRDVTLLAQKAQLYTATVAENAIALARGNRLLTLNQKRELVQQVLDRCGLWRLLGDRLEEPVTSLSLAEQRMLTVARLLGGGTRCVLADEPFRDVSDADREVLLEFFQDLRPLCAVIVITHNQQEAQRLADRVCLLAAGQVVEVASAAAFFEKPRSELSRTFLRTGNCWPRGARACPSAELDDAAEITEEEVLEPAPRHPSWHPSPEECRPRPRGFHWILPGRLGGTQWPGLLQAEGEDLRALADLGVVHLVSLTEQAFPVERLAPYGMIGHHEPIVDMDVPSQRRALDLCVRVSHWIDSGTPVVIHCKAGLGRTGTLLACCLVYRGQHPLAAIHEVRQVNRYYIQSQRQLDFIPAFAEFLSQHRQR